MNEVKRPEHKTDAPELRAPEHLQAIEARQEKVLSNLSNSLYLEKMRDELPVKSEFSSENFRAENSFDAKAKRDYPELLDVKNKYVDDVKPMRPLETDSQPKCVDSKYTPEEVAYLKDIRNSVDAPTSDTKMQKIFGPASKNIRKDLNIYLEPKAHGSEVPQARVTGCVAKAEDSIPFTGTPQQCYDNLRLDYAGTSYVDPQQPVYALRFTDGDNYNVPYGKSFGGNKFYDSPNTCNGFTAAKNVVIPEYTIRKDEDGNGAVITGGEIYRINPDGSEDIVARFDPYNDKFVLV